MILESEILPKGALQLISGGTGDPLDRLGMQDMASFTGSAQTATKLWANPNIISNSIRFSAEQDNLNASNLGPDVGSGTPEFDLFAKEAVHEMTSKAGQKCTAIRRIIAPDCQKDSVIAALSAQPGDINIGDPRIENVNMGPLVFEPQRRDVLAKAEIVGTCADLVFGDAGDL